MSNIQLRGHCQRCGRVQAVPNGRMAHHGYEVKFRGQGGYFQGSCNGHNYRPIEVDRCHADVVIDSCRRNAVELRAQIDEYLSGARHPEMVEVAQAKYDPVSRKWVEQMAPWSQAPAYKQVQAVSKAVYQAQNRARFMDDFANQLEKLCDEYHGKPLQEVVKSEGPEPIYCGDKRVSPKRGVLVAHSVYRGQVLWRDEKAFQGRMSSRMWRLLAKVEG